MGWTRWLPGLETLRRYQAEWLPHDIVAGLVLATMLVPVGIAYAIWSGLGIVLISAVALVIYGQKLDFPAMLGMAMIVGGVVVIQLFSKTAGH